MTIIRIRAPCSRSPVPCTARPSALQVRIVHPRAHGHGVPVSYLLTRDAVVRVDRTSIEFMPQCDVFL